MLLIPKGEFCCTPHSRVAGQKSVELFDSKGVEFCKRDKEFVIA